MGLVDSAIDDILEFTSADLLGTVVELDGRQVHAVRKEVSAELFPRQDTEDAMSVEAVRLTMRSSDLARMPVRGMELMFDGGAWSVLSVRTRGSRVKIELMRYTS